MHPSKKVASGRGSGIRRKYGATSESITESPNRQLSAHFANLVILLDLMMYLSVLAVALSFASSAFAQSPFPVQLCNGVDIADKTVEALQQYMIDGSLTSQDLVNCYLERIDTTDIYLSSISEVNPDALAIAATMDEERAEGKFRGPMHGIPFLVKDNFNTDDKHNTSEGTLVLPGGRYSSEATVVTKIRAAGGVLLGHSSLSEAADHRALINGTGGGYSSRTGQGRNPFNLTQPTRGSSSGSVIAVRDNQCAIALGSETHGSLTHPAANLGLYTLKSTPGLMSRYGVVTGSYYHDTPGPLARSMSDVAVMLDIMIGFDANDNMTWEAVPHYPKNGYLAEIVGKDALKGMKLGVPWEPYWHTGGHINTPGQREVYEGRLEELQAAGAEIYNVTMPKIETIANPYGFGHPSNISRDFDHGHVFNVLLDNGYGTWLQNWTFPEDDERFGMSTLKEMADWNDAHNDTTGALGNGSIWRNTISGQDFYDAAIATNGTLDADFWTAFGWGRTTARAAIDGGLVHVTENGTAIAMDGLLIPNGDAGGWNDPCASIPSFAGYPVAVVPIGQGEYAVPYGLCIYGTRWSEANLIRVASAMEDLWKWTATPMFYNYEVGLEALPPRWEQQYPGYRCTAESLQNYACEKP